MSSNCGVLAVRGGGELLESWKFDSTPSYSFPWMAPWTKTGTLMLSPHSSRRSCARAGSSSAMPRNLTQRLSPGLLRRVARVEDDAVERAAEGGMADDLDAHAAVELRRIDVVERAVDRVVGDVREAADRVGRRRAVREVAGRVVLGRSAPRRLSWALALPTNPSDTVSAASASRTSLRNLPGKIETSLWKRRAYCPLSKRRRCSSRQNRTTL